MTDTRYENAKIYKLYCDDYDKIYIGSTIRPLNYRLSDHRTKCKTNNETSKILFEHSNNVKIELIENFPCNSKKELERREGEIIKKNKDICVNRCIVGRTKKEYHQDNKEDILDKKREMYQANKEHILEKTKEYRQKHKEECNARCNEWYYANREYALEKRKEYCAENKEAIQKKRSETMICECGAKIRKGHRARHEKSNKHLAYEENKNEN